MDLERLHKIITETTVQMRKGPMIEQKRKAAFDQVEVFIAPHESEDVPGHVKVDLTLLTVAVNQEKAAEHRAELVELLRNLPYLDTGPSYITLGGVIEDQGAALQLMALGEVLKLWELITPATMGASGEQAQELAGIGYVMMTPYRP